MFNKTFSPLCNFFLNFNDNIITLESDAIEENELKFEEGINLSPLELPKFLYHLHFVF